MTLITVLDTRDFRAGPGPGGATIGFHDAKKSPMLTVHHLENSRSQRILWLLEELGVTYDIKRYGRDKQTSLAPPELLEIHPLGKAPVITDDGVTVAESPTGCITPKGPLCR